MCAPLIGSISIKKYLGAGQIEQVICGGENYDGVRSCNFDWIKTLRQECVTANTNFCFIETGTNFIKDGKTYRIQKKSIQSEMAFKSQMNFIGKPISFYLEDEYGNIPKECLYVPQYRENCSCCSTKMICNGCSSCGKC